MTAVDRRDTSDLFEVQRPFAPVQWAAVIGALVVGLWSLAGLIANPDFTIGPGATSVLVLGVDMNGWHAVSGFLVAIPALMVASRPRLAAAFIALAGIGLAAVGVWALLDDAPLWGLYAFTNNLTDALLHFFTASIWLAGSAHYYSTRRAA